MNGTNYANNAFHGVAPNHCTIFLIVESYGAVLCREDFSIYLRIVRGGAVRNMGFGFIRCCAVQF